MADALVDLTAPGGEEYTWQQLPDAIKALQNGDDIDYIGASGAIDLDENGDATAGVYDIYQYKGGGLEIIGETPVATPEWLEARAESKQADGRGLRASAVCFCRL